MFLTFLLLLKCMKYHLPGWCSWCNSGCVHATGRPFVMSQCMLYLPSKKSKHWHFSVKKSACVIFQRNVHVPVCCDLFLYVKVHTSRSIAIASPINFKVVLLTSQPPSNAWRGPGLPYVASQGNDRLLRVRWFNSLASNTAFTFGLSSEPVG